MLSVSQLNSVTGVKVQSSSLSSNPPSLSIAIIENLFTKLKSYLDQWHPDENFQKAIENVSSALRKQDLIDLELKISSDYLFKISSDWHLAPFYKSCAYAITARDNSIETDEVKKWTLITQAYFLLGQAEGLIDKESQRAIQSNISISSSGGASRARKLALAKIECARLLHANKPPDGWPSVDTVIESIKTELLAFIAQNTLQYIPSRLELNIKKWLKADDIVHASFIETRSQKIKWK